MDKTANLFVRCFCRHRPLLAVCGRDDQTKEPFVHVRVYKNKYVHTDVVVTEGVVRLFCRDCEKWTTIRIKRTNVDMRSEKLPDSIHVD